MKHRIAILKANQKVYWPSMSACIRNHRCVDCNQKAPRQSAEPLILHLLHIGLSNNYALAVLNTKVRHIPPSSTESVPVGLVDGRTSNCSDFIGAWYKIKRSNSHLRYVFEIDEVPGVAFWKFKRQDEVFT